MSLSKFHTSWNSSTIVLVFLTYNVDQAVREESNPATKWSARAARVASLLRDSDAWLMNLQEMRHLDGNPAPESWLANLGSHYKSIVAYRNPTKYSFGQATVYDTRYLFPIVTITKWLSDTPDVPSDTFLDAKGATGFGSVVLFIKFAFVSEGKIITNIPSFWSVNVHFALDEDVKTKSSHKLVELLDSVCGRERFILSGDFNLFPDLQGADQYKILLANGMIDCSSQIHTSQENRRITGTFVGYPHDSFAAKDPRNPTSALDKIFVKNYPPEDPSIPSIAITQTYNNVEPVELSDPWALPSDHLPLLRQITFK